MGDKTKVYVLVSQSLIQMFVLMYLGYKLGTDWWLKSTMWGAILCVVGALIGIITMMTTLMKAGGMFDKRKNV